MLSEDFREKVNLSIYDSKEKMLQSLRILSFIVSILAVSTLIIFYGFPLTETTKNSLLFIIKGSFAFYIIRYFIRFFYSFDIQKFFKHTWFEGLLMLILLIDGIGDIFFNTTLEKKLFEYLGIYSFTHVYFLSLQLYILIIVAYEIGRSTTLIPKMKLNPSLVFILSFIIIISSGTLLLMLPEMTTIPGSMPFIDALFTSTSASCVTGLIVVDTPTYFTTKGLFVIMALIKLGGLNIIAFGTFFALFSKFGVGIKHDSAIEDFVNKNSLFSNKGMLGRIILWSFIIEFLGALAMYFSWNSGVPFTGLSDKIFSSIFHSFSAFNNAGFCLFSDSFYNDHVRFNYIVHIIITLLVFLGSLGFMTMFDLFGLKDIKERYKFPWKHFTFSSKVALYFSFWLVFIGAIAFFILEKNNTLSEHGIFGSIITSVFQSVTRTSGFNTVDIDALTMPMTIIILFLMFVGASPSSTGGGIKTSTFAIIYASVISTIKGKKQPELFKYSISTNLIYKAFAILLFFTAGNLIGIFLLSITEQHILEMEGRNIMDLIFEEVSALGTVGLSTGITSSLSNSGKAIIILSMILGRVGTLTVAFSFRRNNTSSDYEYPEGHTMLA